MATANYLVSALVSTYNSERFMRGLLEDLEAQTLADRLEIVICDSGSTQNERAIVEEFQRRYDNIVYFRTEQRETSHKATNRCIKAARGKYLTLACADDRHKADALERLAAVLDARPDIGLVYANSYITRTENETFDHFTPTTIGHYRWIDFDPVRLLQGCFMGPQPMWRRYLHAYYGFLDEELASAGDWEFWLRLAEGEQFLHIDEFLGLYLFSEKSAEHRDVALTRREVELVKRRYAGREPAWIKRQHLRHDLHASDVHFLIVRDGRGDAHLEDDVRNVSALVRAGRKVSFDIVRRSPDVPENSLNVRTSPPTPTLRDVLCGQTVWQARWVFLLSADAALAAEDVARLLRIGEREPSLAALGPVSNAAPAPQKADADAAGGDRWMEAPYLGSFCLLLRSAMVREAGGVADSLPLPLAQYDLLERLKEAGFKLGCAQGVHVRHEELTEEEGGGYDALAPRMAEAERAMKAGQAAVAEGRYEPAAAEFAIVTETLPEALHGHAALGAALLGADRAEEAVASLRRAVERFPNDAGLWNHLGVALFKRGDVAGAAESFAHAWGRDSGDIQPLINLTHLYRGQRDFARAMVALRQAANAAPENPDVMRALASLSLDMGDTATADRALELLHKREFSHGLSQTSTVRQPE